MSHSTIQFAQVVVPDGVIDLGVGQPDPSVFPAALISRAAVAAFSTDGNAGGNTQHNAEYLQYGAEYGDGHHRLALGAFLSTAYGFDVDPKLLFTTNGNSQALDMVCGTFARPGDTVVVEEPTYFLARGIFADRQLRTEAVAMDGDGLDTEALATTLASLRDKGTPARFVYTIPAFHNPTGVTMSAARREHLVALAEEHDCLVVADEVYHLLDATSRDVNDRLPPAMSWWVPSRRVISLGTFSKICAPGLRLGWIHASGDLLESLVGSGLILSGGGLNPVVSAIVTEAMRDGDLLANVASLRTQYTHRIAVTDDALLAHMPNGVSWTRPTGGYFFWLMLPNGIDGKELREAAKGFGVDFRHGAQFSSTDGLAHHIRLSFAYYRDNELVEGIRRLAAAVQSISGK